MRHRGNRGIAAAGARWLTDIVDKAPLSAGLHPLYRPIIYYGKEGEKP